MLQTFITHLTVEILRKKNYTFQTKKNHSEKCRAKIFTCNFHQMIQIDKQTWHNYNRCACVIQIGW